jgi:hypothetical protein
MRRIVTVLGVAALMAATVALTAGAALAQAETVTVNERTTQVEELENPCTGEPITFETTLHTISHMTTTEEGGLHLSSHFNVQGVGVSPSGAKYVINNVESTIANLPSGVEQGPITFTFEDVIMVLRQGESVPEEDFIVRGIIHFTINANGELTSEVAFGETECR